VWRWGFTIPQTFWPVDCWARRWRSRHCIRDDGLGPGLNPHPLIVSDVYFPRVNGVSTSIRSFRLDLARLGLESTLVAPQYPGLESQVMTAQPDDVLRVPARSVPLDPEDRIMNWRALRRCLADVPVERCTLVHIQTPFLAHYAGLNLARARGVPVIATCHTYFEDYVHHYLPLLPESAGSWLARSVMTRQLNAVDAVVSPSDQVRQRLVEYGVTRPIHVIPTGMTEDRFAREIACFREKLDRTAQPVLLNVGRVAFEKNLVSFLLRMFTHVHRRQPDALLVIAGEGPARSPLMREAAQLGLATRCASSATWIARQS
jgi:glycosyltransferase involved in cell wall biosynthesis